MSVSMIRNISSRCAPRALCSFCGPYKSSSIRRPAVLSRFNHDDCVPCYNVFLRLYSSKKALKLQRSIVRTGAKTDTAEGMPPLTRFGQVMSSSVGFVRVELYEPHSVTLVDGKLHRTGHNEARGSEADQEAGRDSGQAPSSSSSSPSPSSVSSSVAAAVSAVAEGDPPAPAAPRQQLLCNLRSILRKLGKKVLVGDQVCVSSVDWSLGRATVEDILERSSELVDPAIANIDHALLVFALDCPPFEELQVSKFLVSMEASGLPFTLLLNKTDLVPEEEVQRRVEQVRSWGYQPLVVSCEHGRGLPETLEVLSRRTSVVAGPSGAGKSSLINTLRLGRHRIDQDVQVMALSPSAISSALAASSRSSRSSSSSSSSSSIREQASSGSSPDNDDDYHGTDPEASEAGGTRRQAKSNGDPDITIFEAPSRPSPSGAAASTRGSGFLVVGEMTKMGRGMHTTTSAALIRLPGGGLMADTPGFSQPSLSQITSTDLASLFPEFNAIVEQQPCRFSDCAHLLEPGCSVTEKEDSLERYPHYVKMLLDIKEREESDIKALQMAKQAREGSGKVKSGRGGSQRIEARLDSKKHRGTSRMQSRLGLMQSLDD